MDVLYAGCSAESGGKKNIIITRPRHVFARITPLLKRAFQFLFFLSPQVSAVHLLYRCIGRITTVTHSSRPQQHRCNVCMAVVRSTAFSRSGPNRIRPQHHRSGGFLRYAWQGDQYAVSESVWLLCRAVPAVPAVGRCGSTTASGRQGIVYMEPQPHTARHVKSVNVRHGRVSPADTAQVFNNDIIYYYCKETIENCIQCCTKLCHIMEIVVGSGTSKTYRLQKNACVILSEFFEF